MFNSLPPFLPTAILEFMKLSECFITSTVLSPKDFSMHSDKTQILSGDVAVVVVVVVKIFKLPLSFIMLLPTP